MASGVFLAVAAQGGDPVISAPGAPESENLEGAAIVEQQLLRDTFGKFDVVCFIDKSASMLTPDCPGGRSRWRWCFDQTRALLNAVEALPNHKVNIVLFNDGASVYSDARLRDVGVMFATNSPVGGTKIAEPLGNQIDEFYDRWWHADATTGRRRLLVAVITDGGMQDMEAVRQTIARTTAKLNDADTIRVVFLQIGQDDEGTAALRELDTGLRNRGSAFDIVDYVPFSTLQANGLTRTLVNLMSSAASSPPRQR